MATLGRFDGGPERGEHRTHFRTTPDVIAQRGKKFRYDLLINYYHVATLFHISTKYQAHFSQMVNSANHVMFTKL